MTNVRKRPEEKRRALKVDDRTRDAERSVLLWAAAVDELLEKASEFDPDDFYGDGKVVAVVV